MPIYDLVSISHPSQRPAMIYLVYASTATHLLNASEIAALFQKCRDNNRRNGITGLLLYSNGQFIQLVEGHEADVMRCYEKICHDPRHTEVLKLVQKPLRSRVFNDCSMGVPEIEAANLPEGFSSFLSEPVAVGDYGSSIHEGLFLLLSFKKQMQISRN